MKSSRLTFKGDSKKPKTKKRKHIDPTGSSSPAELQGWVVVSSKEDIVGPLMLLSNATPTLSCLAGDPHFRLFLSPTQSQNLQEVEPTQVSQVFVAKRLPDSSKVSLKSCFDRHLGTDKFGLVECDKEAVGMAHEFEIIQKEDGWAFLSNFGHYLSVQMAPGGTLCKDAKLRCDSTFPGLQETFIILGQAAQKQKRIRQASEEEVDIAQVEMEKISKFHGHAYGKIDYGQNVGVGLSKAVKEGKLNEALVEKRSKMKRDKVCLCV